MDIGYKIFRSYSGRTKILGLPGYFWPVAKEPEQALIGFAIKLELALRLFGAGFLGGKSGAYVYLLVSACIRAAAPL